MKFTSPLNDGRFIRRYKRFFADIQWGNEIITAHVPNTGSLKGCLIEGAPCRFTISDDPKRKLKYTLQMIKVGRTWVGIHTGLPNTIVWEAFESKSLPHWKKFQWGRREVKINDQSRIDLVFWDKKNPQDPSKKINTSWFQNTRNGAFHFVEVKNVTFRNGDFAQFPDAVSTRAQKHLLELMKLIEKGHSAEIFFTVQRNDCKYFAPADEIDPEYGRLLREAKKAGVLISPYSCSVNPKEVQVNRTKKLVLSV